jgi:HSP20 family protein
MAGIRDEINRLFDMTIGRPPFEGWELSEWGPAVDVYEENDKVIVEAQLPGMTDKDVDVSIVDNTLAIKGERKKEEERKEENYYRRETAYGAFHRSIPLPAAVASEGGKASFKDGLLKVEMPKTEKAKPKQIQVEVS